MAGSLDDNPPKLFEQECQYVVLGRQLAQVYVSKTATMSRGDIAAQLRRVADYIDSIDSFDDDDCDGNCQ
jgi:hypothetical protein